MRRSNSVLVVVVTRHGGQGKDGKRFPLGPFRRVRLNDADRFVEAVTAYLTERGWMDHVLEIRQKNEWCLFAARFEPVEMAIQWFKTTYRNLEDLISLPPPPGFVPVEAAATTRQPTKP